jgi:hypothetical protein
VTLTFASDAWLEVLGTEVAKALARLPEDVAFSFGERYVDGDDRSRGWHVRRRLGTCSFVATPADDVDVELVIDLDVARRLSAPRSAELAQLEREAVRDGRICWRGDPRRLPTELSAVHDRMVELTTST